MKRFECSRPFQLNDVELHDTAPVTQVVIEVHIKGSVV